MAFSIHAADFYVSPDGSDLNPGSAVAPFQSLAHAQEQVRQSSAFGRSSITVHVREGIYYLPEPWVFGPEDSGTETAPIVYRAEEGSEVVLSGGIRLALDWKPFRDGIYEATTPADLEIDQLFVDGQRQRMARYPNYDANKPTAAYQGFSADAFSKERAANWSDPAGGYIHAMHSKRWGGYHYLITGKDADGEITYEGGWQNNRQMGMHKEFRMVENIFEELDAPGEWFHNSKTNTLYYKPEAEVDLEKALIEVVRLRHLVEFQGSIEHPVRFISLKGFTVRHAARTFMDTREPLLRSDWAIYRGGAVVLTGTEDIQLLDMEFDQLGGNGVFVNNYNRRTLIKGCHIHEMGGSGVCFVGDPNAVRDPLFEYSEKNDLSKIDRTPGPKTENYPSFGVVEDCLIHGIGRVERQPAGVQISMAMDITVRDTSIYDCARAGINISEGTWGGHLIERVDVFDTVLETHDHGSFNSWGRDRFWSRGHFDASQKAVEAEPNLPFLDAVKTTVIRDSRWRCDHGWDIDLDDGSSNYVIYNNLMLNGGLKLREGFRRRAWNNIIVNNALHPHVWFHDSGDEFFSNIVMTSHRPISLGGFGKTVDRNLFFTLNPDAAEPSRTQFGWDQKSIVGDPLFLDPENGDFRVGAGSPAFELGFSNFPMDQFGVKKPALKAIARTPIIPKLVPEKENLYTRKSAIVASWMGANLHALEGEEFSAYGVSKEEGGVALMKVPEESPAALAGLKRGDLIQEVNGDPVSSVEELYAALKKAGPAPLHLGLIRNQERLPLTIFGGSGSI